MGVRASPKEQLGEEKLEANLGPESARPPQARLAFETRTGSSAADSRPDCDRPGIDSSPSAPNCRGKGDAQSHKAFLRDKPRQLFQDPPDAHHLLLPLGGRDKKDRNRRLDPSISSILPTCGSIDRISKPPVAFPLLLKQGTNRALRGYEFPKTQRGAPRRKHDVAPGQGSDRAAVVTQHSQPASSSEAADGVRRTNGSLERGFLANPSHRPLELAPGFGQDRRIILCSPVGSSWVVI